MSAPADLNTRVFSQGTYGKGETEEIAIVLANGDNIASLNNMGRLPAGLRIFDWSLTISTASNASVTANFGLKSVSGTNQDNATFFFTAQALSATGFFRKTNASLPFTIAQDMYVQIVIAGANVTQATVALLQIQYRNIGTL